MVVEVVGTIPVPQASAACGSSSATSDWRKSVEPSRPAMPISGMAKRRVWATISAISGVSPLLDRTSATSPFVTMPRSPWLASAGCTNCAGVPVEASVAAILRPTWPDLPMPDTTTRPVACRISRTAS